MAQVALHREDDRTLALRDIVGDLLKMEEPRKRIAGMMSGLDIRYDLGQGHPLVGRRMPDLDVVTANGPRRVFSFLHKAQPVLLNLGAPRAIDITPWSDRVQYVDAKYAGKWELPVLGEVAAPAAVLIRPDGYVAVGRRRNTAGAGGSANDLVRHACDTLGTVRQRAMWLRSGGALRSAMWQLDWTWVIRPRRA